ncbi:hypothetical protein HK101_012044 [Irineochytrium annulatum]|nr:hypothetical protein HK101_012044 [Irineochytrium annulatum]
MEDGIKESSTICGIEWITRAEIPAVDPALYAHFDVPRNVQKAVATAAKALAKRPDFDLLRLAGRKMILRECDQEEGRRIQLANLAKLKREGQFVAEAGESDEDQLSRCLRSQFHDEWNLWKRPGQIFVRCLLCGLLCCKMPTGRREIVHHNVDGGCISKMQKGWHWVTQVERVEGTDRGTEPESFYLLWLRHLVLGIAGHSTTMTQWELVRHFLDFADKDDVDAELTLQAVKSSLKGGGKVYEMFKTFLVIMSRRDVEGGMELPCVIRISEGRVTALEERKWSGVIMDRKVFRGEKRIDFIFNKKAQHSILT